MKNTRQTKYLKVINIGRKKSNKESAKLTKNDIVQFARKILSVDISTAKKTTTKKQNSQPISTANQMAGF